MFHKQLLAAAASLVLTLAAGAAAAAPAGAVPQLKPYHQSIKNCAACHTKENAVGGNAFVAPSDSACISCHGSYDDLAKKTDKLPEPNPHKSHHYGEGLACTACHMEHRPSAVYCNNCHEFRYEMP